MAESKEKRILVRMKTNLRYEKKTIPAGTLVRGPKSIVQEWVDDDAAEIFDETQIKILEL